MNALNFRPAPAGERAGAPVPRPSTWAAAPLGRGARDPVAAFGDERLPDRFWRFVHDSGSCWLWTGAALPRGYSRFYQDRRVVYGHRLAYERLVAPIAAGLQLDHLCRTPACVNPAHLEPVTNRQNNLRSPLLGGATHCRRGHEFSSANTAWRPPDGSSPFSRRRCRRCDAVRTACRRSKHRAAAEPVSA